MNTYIDCGSGVAGDMLLGSLIDLGLSAAELGKILHHTISLQNWKISVKRTERQGWPARSFTVEGDRFFGSVDKMKRVVRRSRLPHAVKKDAVLVLNRLLRAEKKAHGGNSKGIFDPGGLGLLDTVVDVVGCCWGFWRLGLTRLTASTVNSGRMAPATVQILKEHPMPTYSTQSQYELATPTGIAILSVLCEAFGPMPVMNIRSAGYGAGLKDIPGKPNILAIYRGDSVSFASSTRSFPEGPSIRSVYGPMAQPRTRAKVAGEARGEATPLESVLLLETVIDDMDPRLYPHVSELLMQAGALDAWWISAGMKKGRPGIAFSVLCRPENEKRLVHLLFNETTTLGIRRLPVERWTLARRAVGSLKTALLPAGGTKTRVEYELARLKALSLSIPLRKLLK